MNKQPAPFQYLLSQPQSQLQPRLAESVTKPASVEVPPPSTSFDPFVLTVPSSASSGACSARVPAIQTSHADARSPNSVVLGAFVAANSAPTASVSAAAAAAAAASASSSAPASIVPAALSSLAQSTTLRNVPAPAAPQSDFLMQMLPSLQPLSDQTASRPIGADHSFNFHQQLVVLHAQALVLTDAVMKTRQFVDQQKLQKQSRSKKVQIQIQKQFDQLVAHQQRHEQQFLTMLQRQQDTMQQNQPHISIQQQIQQQAQFFVYKQLMDNLVRRSQQLGVSELLNSSEKPISATTAAGDRLNQLQPVVLQQQLDEMRLNSGFGFVQPSFDQATLAPVGRQAAVNCQRDSNSGNVSGNAPGTGTVGTQNTQLRAAVSMQPQKDGDAATPSQMQTFATNMHSETQPAASHLLASQRHISRPLSFQESIRMNFETQQRELEAQIHLQEQHRMEINRSQDKSNEAQQMHQQKVHRESQIV
jgi:hypothetical protein